MRAQLCRPPNCHMGSWFRGITSPDVYQVFCCTRTGWKGRAFSRINKSLEGSDVLKPEEETETPLHLFKVFFDPE